MKRFRAVLALILVSATLTIALSGCSGDKAGDNSSAITIGIPQDLDDSLDPHKAVAAGTKEVLFNIFEGLMKTNENGELYPAVASDCKVSDDGLTYTFTLREGVKFHNGEEVTAEDVIYCIDKCADASTGTPLISAFSNIESDTMNDANQIVITLKEQDPDFLQYMTMAIIPENNQNPETTPIGTGPYKFVSRTPQQNIQLERFDDYWGEKAHIKNVTLKICANADSIVMELMGGSIDMFCRITAAQEAQLKGSNMDILEGTMNLVQALYLNNAVKPFDDPNVRKALCMAVDPKEIIDIAFDGQGTEIGSSMFPAFGKYYMPELADTYSPDIEGAKELLKQAGYPDGFEFTVSIPSNYQPHIDTAQVIVEQLKKIGVTATIQLIEWDTWLSEVYANRNYESTLVGVDASTMTARALLERFTSTAKNNFINYKNPAYDEAFHNAVSSSNDEEQTKYYKECEVILSEDAANVYIQDLAELVALNNKYGGYTFYPIYVQDYSKLYIKNETNEAK